MFIIFFSFFSLNNTPVLFDIVPTGCAVYPKEFLTWPPKSYVERLFNLVHWTEMKKGGHFAALEQPSSLIKDIQNFYKKVDI